MTTVAALDSSLDASSLDRAALDAGANPGAGPRPDAEALWAPQRRSTLAQARRRSRFLRTFRWLCILISAGSIALTLGFVAAHSVQKSFGLRDQISAGDALRMVNPRFSGVDSRGEFMLTASTAVRRSRLSDLVDLEQPYYRGSKGQTITAPRGVYRQDKRTLELLGAVEFKDESGNVFETSYAMIDTTRDVARGDKPVRGAGPLGVVRADAYEIQASGGRVRMSGNVRGTVTGSREK